ncbi:hypothetical protein [Xanthobacter flavus]|uniref:hypothetical protein n=1 Tax=Xanthobacter flavus TaxID=281 RepID=UPI0037274BD3
MGNFRVYKADGTVQCAPTGQGEITLEDMRAELETLIGSANVLSAEKRRGPGVVISRCGSPTGMVNTYLITPRGLSLLFSGIIGADGFLVWPAPEVELAAADPGGGPVVPWPIDDTTPWPWSTKGDQETAVPFDRPVIWPWQAVVSADNPKAAYTALLNIIASAASVGAHPTTLEGIIGLRCRTYTVGARLTLDHSPTRINFEISKEGRISRIWFG